MHNNFYFLKQLTPEIGHQITGMELLTCFSQNKNELVLGFSNQHKEFFIQATLNPEFCCLSFPEAYTRAKRNSIDLFLPVIKKKVLGVKQYENERCFSIHLEEFSLLFKMHGNRSNIILFNNKEPEPLLLFRNNLKQDWNIRLDALDRPLQQDYDTFREMDCNVKSVFPTFDKVVHDFLKLRNYESKECDEKWQILEETVPQLNKQEYYITRLQTITTFSLLPYGEIELKLSNPIEAINQFFYNYSRTHYLEKEKNDLVRALERKKNQTESYISKSIQKLDDLQKNTKHEEIANILMANLHQIPKNSEEVELLNFYTNEPIKIKLKRDISPQKVAENFYRKSKNQKLELDELKKNIEHKEHQLLELTILLEEIINLNDVRSLRKVAKENNLYKNFEQQEEILPYKEVSFQGYQILIGKNAKSNDTLIQKYAKKDDLWLHAKDTSGSHVVVKNKSGQNFPKPVLEKAAGIAAFYSKQKNDSLCPVIYTPRKYVRKIKGAPAGVVMVDKESVILVKPCL